MQTSIKAILIDCDGTLTDGNVLYLSNGIQGRSFSTTDGEGFAILARNNIQTAIVTSSMATEIENRAKWLRIPVFMGIKDKADFAFNYALDNNLSCGEICFMGNDINDIDAMLACGYSACPSDAEKEVRRICQPHGYVAPRNGGHGAFRDLVDFLVSRKFNP